MTRGSHNDFSHPLLNDPALFFLNDGMFSENDKDSIRQFEIDANAGDKSKIGKFGLGQKSVFHFCEAFFYITRSDDMPQGYGEFINPRQSSSKGDPKREDWVELSEKDRHNLEKYMIDQDLICKTDSLQYFLLWIPLRQEASDKRYIFSKLYDADSVKADLPENMASKIAQLLPSLQHLKTVQYFLEQDNNILLRQFKVSLLDNAERCRYPKNGDDYPTEGTYRLRGQISIDDASSNMLQFGGQEKILSMNDFMSLISSSQEGLTHDEFWQKLEHSLCWPKRQVWYDDDVHDKPDKVLPHCATLFTRKRKQGLSATLTVQWAVFLPVAGKEQEAQEEFFECKCNGDYDYLLLLHGYLFVDSGRQYIEGLKDILNGNIYPEIPQSEEVMSYQWNRILATEGTLRSILPALKEFVDSHQITSDEITYLCAALRKSSCFAKESNHRYIYSDYQWIYRLNPTNSGWCLLDQNTRLRSLPLLPPNWDIFPALKQIAEQDYLTLDKRPNLRCKQSEDAWTGGEISDVLVSLNADKIFSSAEYLDYLVQFLQHTDTLSDPSVKSQLHKLIIDGFRSVKLATLEGESIRPFVQACIKLLEPKKRFKFKGIPKSELNTNQIASILESVFKLNLSSLLVYEPFEPEEYNSRSLGTLDDSSIVCLLQYIAKLFKNSDKAYHSIADHLLDQFLAPETSPRILKDQSSLKIFRGYSYQQQKYQVYSYHELKPIDEGQKSLFRSGKNPANEAIAKVLQDAITDRQIVLLPKTKADLLKQVLVDIPQCDRAGCAKLIGDRPPLSQEPFHRQPLLKELSSESGIDKQLRYLLHSNTKQYEDTGDLYVIPTDSSNNQFWEKIGRQVLAKRDESWRLLNQDLVDQLLPATQNRLSIKPLQAEAVIQEIERDVQVHGANCLDTTEWQDADYDTLLGYLYTVGKETLWKQLPLHKTEQGDRVSINDRTFRTSDTGTSFTCPSDLAALVILIPLSSNHQIQRGQKEWISEWSAQQALDILLNQAEPHKYCHTILDILNQVDPDKLLDELPGQEKEHLRNKLKQTAWLPTQSGNGISPSSIVRLPKSLNQYESTLRSVVDGYSEEELSSAISKSSKAYKWLSNYFQPKSELNILEAILGVI